MFSDAFPFGADLAKYARAHGFNDDDLMDLMLDPDKLNGILFILEKAGHG